MSEKKGHFGSKALDQLHNVNHKLNMLLMPQDREVAKLLGLPRHLQLKDGDAPGLSDACTNHPIYNDMVETKLTAIINAYKQSCADAQKQKKKHDVPEVKLDKTRLEKLSGTLLDWILGTPDESQKPKSKKRPRSPGGESLDARASKRHVH